MAGRALPSHRFDVGENRLRLLHRHNHFYPAPDLHLVHQAGHVVLDGLLGEIERSGDLSIGLAEEELSNNLLLPPAEAENGARRGRRLPCAHGAHDLRREFLGDDQLVAHPDRLKQFLDRIALEDEAGCAGFERLYR